MKRRPTARRSTPASIGAALVILLAISVGRTAAPSSTPLDDADQHLRAARFDFAERSFREALALDPQSARAHIGLAQTLLARRELNQALAEAEIGVQLSPEPSDLYTTVASVRDRAGDLSGAVTALDRYLTSPTAAENQVRRLRAKAYRALLGIAGREPMRIVDPGKIVTVPFTIVNDKVLVKVSAQGGIPVDMVLDTGAEHLVVSERTVERAGLPRVGGGDSHGPDMTFVEIVDIGGLAVRRVPAIVRREPLRVVRNRTGDAFSPISVDLSMIVDYERRELTVGRRLPFEPADVELPLYVLGLPVILGTTAGTPVSFVIDTGSAASAVSPLTIASAVMPLGARRIPMMLFDVWGKRQADAVLVTPGLDLEFGAIRLKQYPVIVRSWPDVQAVHGFEMGGILGYDFLRRYRVTIDLDRRVVRLKRQLPDRP